MEGRQGLEFDEGQRRRSLNGLAAPPQLKLQKLAPLDPKKRSRRLLHDDGLKTTNVGFDAEVRLVRVPLGVKDIHLVGATGRDAELSRLLVEIDGGGDRHVHTAQVEG